MSVFSEGRFNEKDDEMSRYILLKQEFYDEFESMKSNLVSPEIELSNGSISFFSYYIKQSRQFAKDYVKCDITKNLLYFYFNSPKTKFLKKCINILKIMAQERCLHITFDEYESFFNRIKIYGDYALVQGTKHHVNCLFLLGNLASYLTEFSNMLLANDLLVYFYNFSTFKGHSEEKSNQILLTFVNMILSGNIDVEKYRKHYKDFITYVFDFLFDNKLEFISLIPIKIEIYIKVLKLSGIDDLVGMSYNFVEYAIGDIEWFKLLVELLSIKGSHRILADIWTADFTCILSGYLFLKDTKEYPEYIFLLLKNISNSWLPLPDSDFVGGAIHYSHYGNFIQRIAACSYLSVYLEKSDFDTTEILCRKYEFDKYILYLLDDGNDKLFMFGVLFAFAVAKTVLTMGSDIKSLSQLKYMIEDIEEDDVEDHQISLVSKIKEIYSLIEINNVTYASKGESYSDNNSQIDKAESTSI